MEETGMTRGKEGQGEGSQSSWVSGPHLDSDSGPRNAKEGSEAHRSQAGFPSGTERRGVSTHDGLGAGLLHTPFISRAQVHSRIAPSAHRCEPKLSVPLG